MAWKITTLVLLIVVAILTSLLVVRTSRARLVDQRLIGTWVSDRDRTVAEFEEVWGVTEERLGGVGEVLGKMSIKFTETTIETDLNGEKMTALYTVLAFDMTSVVLRDDSDEGNMAAEMLGVSTFSKIHFDGNDAYWVYSGTGAIKEYFRRANDLD